MLTDKFGETITTSDLLAGILALLPDNGRIAGKEKLHTLFSELRSQYAILREFDGFDTRWPQVWSEKLDVARIISERIVCNCSWCETIKKSPRM